MFYECIFDLVVIAEFILCLNNIYTTVDRVKHFNSENRGVSDL